MKCGFRSRLEPANPIIPVSLESLLWLFGVGSHLLSSFHAWSFFFYWILDIVHFIQLHGGYFCIPSNLLTVCFGKSLPVLSPALESWQVWLHQCSVSGGLRQAQEVDCILWNEEMCLQGNGTALLLVLGERCLLLHLIYLGAVLVMCSTLTCLQ